MHKTSSKNISGSDSSYIDCAGLSDKAPLYPCENNELLCLILDLSPFWWSQTTEGSFQSFLDTIVAFSIMYLSFSTKKELAIIGVVPEKSEYIYTTEISTDTFSPLDAKVRMFQSLDFTVRTNIIRLFQQSQSSINSVNMSGALIKALCYYNQRDKQHIAQTVQSKLNGRFVIVRTSIPDSSSCFMSMMNGIFTAQKLEICIDVCLLDESVCTSNTAANVIKPEAEGANILRQSVDMTNGIYLRINKLGHLYQNLVTLFLPNKDDRAYMTMITRTNVDSDYRASCFCHGKLVSMGYVCSLCLAVFCRYSPLCKCCWTLLQDRKLKFNTES